MHIDDAMEQLAARWIEQHPEYHSQLTDVERALSVDYSVEGGQANPFLHLSMHLSIEEQIAIDQPQGVREVFAQLASRYGEHEAHHHMMDALGQMLWESQRSGQPPNQNTYLLQLRQLL